MALQQPSTRTGPPPASGEAGGSRAPLLEMTGVSKGFPGVQALQDVHLRLDHGEVLALVGENGAGKSTLMKLLTGIYEVDQGTIRLNGEEIHVEGPRAAQELGISIIHQEFQLVPDLSVAQNIYMGREPRTGNFFISDRTQIKKAQELFDRLGIDQDPAEPVSNLTVARQQMVEVARALSFNAKVLVMDEPTAALNDAEVDTLFRLIGQFISPETGVIYISHRMEEIKRIADRITVLRDGHYIDTVDAASTSIRDVISLMVGRKLTGESRAVPADLSQRAIVLDVQHLSTPKLLRDVSFQLRQGEILGFAGLMGAGRTETARAIVGADRVSGGSIEVKGKRATIRRPADAMRHGIGYLSEDRKRYGLLLDQDVTWNVMLSSMDRATSASFIQSDPCRSIASDYVDKLQIKTPSIRQLVKYLSGGNQQKVVIAKWLARDCDILIFDEPTRGIDVGAKEEIYELLGALVDEGKSIIMISSELPEVLRLSDRIVVMCNGRVTGTLDKADATQENIMELATQFGAETVKAS